MHAIRYVGSVDARDVSLPYPAYAQLSCWAAYTFTAVGLSTGYRKVGISRVVSSEPSVSWEGMYRRMPGVANGGWLFSGFCWQQHNLEEGFK